VSELHYTYRVEWSPEDEEWVGLVAEFPSLSWLDPDPLEALRGVRDLVDGVVEDMRESGEVPPTPLADRRYSGKVFVRTSPELHRRLTIEAAEQGVSVNQWAMQKLAERSGDVPRRSRPDVESVLDAKLDRVAAQLHIECSKCGAAPQRLASDLQQTGHPVFWQDVLPGHKVVYVSLHSPDFVWPDAGSSIVLMACSALKGEFKNQAERGVHVFGRDFALGE
jgi:predicted HicB family RNase H-like nuclease